jgi:hypothetical protein
LKCTFRGNSKKKIPNSNQKGKLQYFKFQIPTKREILILKFQIPNKRREIPLLKFQIPIFDNGNSNIII